MDSNSVYESVIYISSPAKALSMDDTATMIPLSQLVPKHQGSRVGQHIYEAIYVNWNIKNPIKLGKLAQQVAKMKAMKDGFKLEYKVNLSPTIR